VIGPFAGVAPVCILSIGGGAARTAALSLLLTGIARLSPFIAIRADAVSGVHGHSSLARLQ
jgi:hypothetical protein